MEKLKLKVGVPAVIALQNVIGKIKESTIPNAPSDVMFTLCDGRVAFLPMSVADRIRQAGIQAGQSFEILKASMYDFRLKKIGAGSVAETTPPAIAQTTSSPSQGANYNGNGNRTPPPPPPAHQAPPPPQPQLTPLALALTSTMCALVDAAIETKAYASRKGFDLGIEDLRCMAATALISVDKKGGR